MMRGVLVEEFTEFETLKVQDCPIPPLERGQVRIKTQAAGVSFATSLIVSGRYQRKPPLPFVPGTEVAGIVTETGGEVARLKVGDRVACILDWGGLAEEAVAHEVNTFVLPPSLEFHRAICFTNSYGTSCAALTWPHLLHVQDGETLLVHGGAGGVGIAAIEIGKILGARVIATAGSAEKLAIAKAHGADHVINYRDGPFRDQVLEITGGRGANAIYDPVGGAVFEQSLRCIAPEGRIMPVGFAGGTIQQIPANLLLVKNITVCGLNMGYYVGWSPDDVRHAYGPRMQAMLAQLFAWFEQGRLNPRVSHSFALDDFQAAMAVVLGRLSQGRVAIVMDEEARRLGK
ncbi:MAG: NADPH:quinone oxidoreductase family protein [Proteobacteria bacterium]|nr:NADPH:quinone oxidoreductase family protein [Pseudomonadota bacterium]